MSGDGIKIQINNMEKDYSEFYNALESSNVEWLSFEADDAPEETQRDVTEFLKLNNLEKVAREVQRVVCEIRGNKFVRAHILARTPVEVVVWKRE